AVGVDSAHFALLLVDPPDLFRSYHEFAKERLGDPAGKAGRQAITEVIPLNALLLVGELLLKLGPVLRRQLRAGRLVVRNLRIEPRATVMRPDARPVGELVPREPGAATSFLLQLEEVLFRLLVPPLVLLSGGGSRRERPDGDDGDDGGHPQ